MALITRTVRRASQMTSRSKEVSKQKSRIKLDSLDPNLASRVGRQQNNRHPQHQSCSCRLAIIHHNETGIGRPKSSNIHNRVAFVAWFSPWWGSFWLCSHQEGVIVVLAISILWRRHERNRSKSSPSEKASRNTNRIHQDLHHCTKGYIVVGKEWTTYTRKD